MKNTKLLKKYGPWALVTGAAQGIGLAFTKDLLAADFKVLLIDKDKEVLNKTMEGLHETYPHQAKQVVLDLADSDFFYPRAPLSHRYRR